ncbi:protein trichome birefringence-like 33 isoform X2 [Phoenix dactylifera]|uniref:Protein trichome birefringence-like 33 isoform X2 n=1 Tax=Phoenix dactylifera TaxID=42345 RepID=A0A8B9A3L9_PHODC|nr:protein trichome birefringence-like 33 isoform X2 [Phoenix dactylifera]
MKPLSLHSMSSSFYLISLSLITFLAFLYAAGFTSILKKSFLNSKLLEYSAQVQEESISNIPKQEKDVGMPFAVGRTEEGCDVFDGRWVYDEVSRPHYGEHECRYISAQARCQAYGRPDKAYQRWRWQPHGCSLPSFNATFMLEKLRGKRMMFVGDSLARGQFTSMACLLRRASSKFAKSHKHFRSHGILRARKHNATIEFYWAPFLVESNCDNATVHKITDRIVNVHPESINKHAPNWKGVDVLIFNTYMWWIRDTNIKTLSVKWGLEYVKEMKKEDAYRLVLKRMVRWVEENIDPEKTRVFFTSLSPTHYRSIEWGGKPDGTCYNQTTPITDPTYWGSSASKSMMRVVEQVLGESKIPIIVLNITKLSAFRKDAHASIYKQQMHELMPEQLANPNSYADCTHWCLPGLQDTWNVMLYTKLFYP